ncbi:hypothetical protein ACLKA6_019309 [Drosophila palustris]
MVVDEPKEVIEPKKKSKKEKKLPKIQQNPEAIVQESIVVEEPKELVTDIVTIASEVEKSIPVTEKPKKQKSKKEKNPSKPEPASEVGVSKLTDRVVEPEIVEKQQTTEPKDLPPTPMSWSSIVSQTTEVSPTTTQVYKIQEFISQEQKLVPEKISNSKLFEEVLKSDSTEIVDQKDSILSSAHDVQEEKPKKKKPKKEKKSVKVEQIQEQIVLPKVEPEPTFVVVPTPSDFKIELPKPKPSVWSQSETYAEVVKKSGFIDNTNIRYQDSESDSPSSFDYTENKPVSRVIERPQSSSIVVVTEFPDSIIPPTLRTPDAEPVDLNEYPEKSFTLSWKEMMDEELNPIDVNIPSWSSVAQPWEIREEPIERTSRAISRPTIEVTEVTKIEEQLQPKEEHGFLEITSKKRNRSRSRSQQSQSSNIGEKPKKKKSKKPKETNQSKP